MSDFTKVTAVILAGGIGTRLQNIVSDRPKVMAEINCKPFITYLLDQLAETDSEQVIISTGYMAKKIEEFIGPVYKSLQVNYSREEKPYGTGGALKLAGQAIGTKYCIVMNGDSYTKFNFVSLLMNHINSEANITIVVKKIEDPSRYGSIQMDDKNNIIEFTEKNKTMSQGLINTGVYFMNTSVLREISGNIPCSLEYDFFPCMIGKGLYGFETDGRFIDIGTPESYSQAEKFFGNKSRVSA